MKRDEQKISRKASNPDLLAPSRSSASQSLGCGAHAVIQGSAGKRVNSAKGVEIHGREVGVATWSRYIDSRLKQFGTR